MTIDDDEVGGEAVGAAQAVDRRLEPAARRWCVEVAEMLTDDRVAPDADRNRAVEMPAGGERSRQSDADVDRQRRIPPGAPENGRTARAHADDGVGTRPRDR